MAIISSLLDFIFPPRESELLVRAAGRKNSLLKTSLFRAHETICLCDYNDPLIRAAIVENKFHDNKQAAILLSKVLENWCEKQMKELILIPLPLSQKRYRDRGYNQVERITELIRPLPEVMINNKILKKIVDTAPQTTLKKSDRLKNNRGVFSVEISNPDLFANKTIVIVDDVCTTGATLASARMALQAKLSPSTKIICLALAH